MRTGDHPRADRIRIAQVTGTAHHRDTQHRDRWPDVITRLHGITRDPHLLAHAVYREDPPEVDELLQQAGADMAEVARIKATPVGVSPLAGMADRITAQHVVDNAKAPQRRS